MEPKKTNSKKTKPVEGFHNWVGVLVEPTSYEKTEGKLPPYHLEVEYIFGYNRKEILDLNGKEIVFASGSLGVVQSVEDGSQRYLVGHDNDVVSIALSDDKSLIATGQVGAEVVVIVWDAKTLKPLSTIKVGKFQGINSLAFSPGDSKKLVGVAADVHNSVFVWEWSTQKLNVSTQLSFAVDKVYFNHGKSSLIAMGEKNINFLTVGKSEAGALEITKKVGLMGQLAKQPTLKQGIPVDPEHSVFCSAQGHIYVFKGVNIVKDIDLKTPVHSMLKASDKSILLVTSDKVVSYDFGADFTAPVRKELCTLPAPVVPVSLVMVGGVLVMGTASGDIYSTTLADPVKFQTHLKSHSDEINNIWMVDANSFATVSDDKTCQVFSVSDHKQLFEIALESPGVSVAASNGLLAIGQGDGTLVVYNVATKAQIHKEKIDSIAIRHLRFSPDSLHLSVGLTSGHIKIYTVQPFKLTAAAQGSSAHIAFLDWSADSSKLQSNSGAYEILYWNANDGSQIKSAHELKDEKWATWTCLLGWPVRGIWSHGQDGSDINCVARSQPLGASNTVLLATGDDSNNVNLLLYPAYHEHAPKKTFRGVHSSHVLAATFTPDAAHLVTAGGDATIVLWKVVVTN